MRVSEPIVTEAPLIGLPSVSLTTIVSRLSSGWGSDSVSLVVDSSAVVLSSGVFSPSVVVSSVFSVVSSAVVPLSSPTDDG